jgi:hypothetical protein
MDGIYTLLTIVETLMWAVPCVLVAGVAFVALKFFRPCRTS